MGIVVLQRDWTPPRLRKFQKNLDEVLSASTARSRFVMALLSGFALLALILAAVGIYGVFSYDVSQRRSEIGVRLTLGASPGNVQRLVLGEGMLLAGFGLLVGAASAFTLGRVMASLLFGGERSGHLRGSLRPDPRHLPRRLLPAGPAGLGGGPDRGVPCGVERRGAWVRRHLRCSQRRSGDSGPQLHCGAGDSPPPG